MTLMETLELFETKRTRGHIPFYIPIMTHYSLKDPEIQGWLDDIGRIYFDTAQLHWNALYLDNKKFSEYVCSELRKICKDLFVCHYLVLTYGYYALSREFKIKVTILKKYKEFIFGYMEALGRMI